MIRPRLRRQHRRRTAPRRRVVVIGHRHARRTRSARHRVTRTGVHRHAHRPIGLVHIIIGSGHGHRRGAARRHRHRPRTRRNTEIARLTDREVHRQRLRRHRAGGHRERRIGALGDVAVGGDADLCGLRGRGLVGNAGGGEGEPADAGPAIRGRLDRVVACIQRSDDPRVQPRAAVIVMSHAAGRAPVETTAQIQVRVVVGGQVDLHRGLRVQREGEEPRKATVARLRLAGAVPDCVHRAAARQRRHTGVDGGNVVTRDPHRRRATRRGDGVAVAVLNGRCHRSVRLLRRVIRR